MLDGGYLASHSSQHVGRCSSVVPHHKRSCHVDVSVGQMLKGLPYLHLTLWLLSDVCYVDKGSLPQSVQVVAECNSSVYVKGLPAVLEGMGRLVWLTGCTKQCHLCSLN